MAFANALQAGVGSGIAAGNAAFGPLLQALDPLRQIQVRSLASTIERQKAETDRIKQDIEFFGSFLNNQEAAGQADSEVANRAREIREEMLSLVSQQTLDVGNGGVGQGTLATPLAERQKESFAVLRQEDAIQGRQARAAYEAGDPQPLQALGERRRVQRIDRILGGRDPDSLNFDDLSSIPESVIRDIEVALGSPQRGGPSAGEQVGNFLGAALDAPLDVAEFPFKLAGAALFPGTFAKQSQDKKRAEVGRRRALINEYILRTRQTVVQQQEQQQEQQQGFNPLLGPLFSPSGPELP